MTDREGKRVRYPMTNFPANLAAASEQEIGALLEPHRYELRVHCYRMLGSLEDAEDMVQETFLRAWRRRDSYAGRATLRAWLYKIATNACLDALRVRAPRRVIPQTRGAAASVDAPIPPDVNEPIWLQPIPDEWFAPDELSPEGRIAQRESVTLAFLAALQLLPPRQRAVLILRDVLDWSANETAALLDMSVPAVKSALHRARATLAQRYEPVDSQPDSAALAQLDAYVRAWENADIPALLTLLRSDATFSMPPIPTWYRGRAEIGRLVGKTIFAGSARGRWRLLPTRANGQVAFGLYRVTPEGRYAAYGVQVLTFDAVGALADIITFRVPSLVGRFGLPAQV